MDKIQRAFVGSSHDLDRLRDAAGPALEFVSTALKPDAVQAFLMCPYGGRLDIASKNLPAPLSSIDSKTGIFDHSLLHTAKAKADGNLLVRTADLIRNRKTEAYLDTLKQEGFYEVGEFQFEDAGMFVGGLTLFWKKEPSDIVEDAPFLDRLHDFLEFSFLRSWRRTTVGRSHVLRTFLDLTPRECDVVEMLCLGRTNQDAALCLGISLPTVKTHLASLFGKFEVENRTALIRRALFSIDSIQQPRMMQ